MMVFGLVATVVVAVLLGAALIGGSGGSGGSKKTLPVTTTPAKATREPVTGSPVYERDGFMVPAKSWEAEFDAALWTPEVVQQLSKPPFAFHTDGAMVKEVDDSVGKKYRVLSFDLSGEVQGAIALGLDGRADFGKLVLEYIRTMSYGMMFAPQLACDKPGNALVLGLGAGSLANLLHSRFSNYQVDVAEVSENVREAAVGFLGTPQHDARMKIFMDGAESVFLHVPADRMYDVVVMDAYMAGPRIPPSLETDSFVSGLAARMTPGGVLVLNFCLPFYDLANQLRVLQPYRDAFAHLHMIESTPTSKVLVAYNGPIRQDAAAVRARIEQANKMCQYPMEFRGESYQLYLGQENWKQSWERMLHQEATSYFCETNRLPARYCKWFIPRQILAAAFPQYHFGCAEQMKALTKANMDVDKAKIVMQQMLNFKNNKDLKNS